MAPTTEPTTMPTVTTASGDKLVYTSSFITIDEAGPGDIYTINIDGTGLKNLTNSEAIYEIPFWSPDGSQLAFNHTVDGKRQIYTMAADGTGLQPVPNTGPLDFVYGWSSDGRSLIVTSLENVQAEIVALSLDGEERVNLTRHPAEDNFPSLSPDGKKMVFASDRDSPEGEQIFQIYTMDLDGSNLNQLTDYPLGALFPQWSPDGKYIAFHRSRAAGYSDIFLMEADGANQMRITDERGGIFPLSWSPDGQKLLSNHVFGANADTWEILIVDISDLNNITVEGFPNEEVSAAFGHQWQPAAKPPVEPVTWPDMTIDEPPQAESIALFNGTLIDGTGADPLPEAAVVVVDGLISAVGPLSDIDIPADAQIVDVEGATILPGFINSHVHNAYDAYALASWAQEGVTAVCDLTTLGSTEARLSVSHAFRDATLVHPQYARIVTASPMFSPPDGYGFLVVTSVEDAREKALAVIEAGVDLIKIGIEDSLPPGTKPALLPADQAAAIVEVAHEHNIPVVAHVSLPSHVEIALEAGVDGMAHMIRGNLSEELIAATVDKDICWIPTLELWSGVGQKIPIIQNMERLVEGGGKIALGTDYAGFAIDFDLGMPITEIELMEEAGMTPMQIIVAATKNAAHICGQDEILGTVEPGKVADILVVQGDPLTNIQVLLNTRLVMRDGTIIRQEP
ncbi:MAG: PD40 domain-containing protein, partial [Anaerolineaceae bacterium]